MNALQRAVLEHGYSQLPKEIIDSYGLRVRIRGGVWRVNSGGQRSDGINIGRFPEGPLKYAVARFLIYKIQTVSACEAVNTYSDISALLESDGLLGNVTQDNIDDFAEQLSDAMFRILSSLRSRQRLDRFYRISRWYLWCTDQIPACGFDPETALSLERLTIPGNIKGEAVRNRDGIEGPLSFDLEEPLVRKALLNDQSDAFEHVQQRVLVALCLAFGRNPLSFTQLREEDLFNFTVDQPMAEDLWVLRIPSVKKRSRPRELFRDEAVEPRLAEMIRDLIRRNRAIDTTFNGLQLPRPLFMRNRITPRLVDTDSEEWGFHISSGQLGIMVGSWAERMRLISPRTGEALRLTPRRLRYTFACNMARQGVSKRVLAAMLDHTDTQHVHVYYDLFDELVPMLDSALAQKIGSVLGWFKGKVVNENDETLNGDRHDKYVFFVGEECPTDQTEIGVCGEQALCHLDPPYSCYLCPKFQPYRHADHGHVLTMLLEQRKDRISRYESARLGVQLDDVIYAVAEVVRVCEEEL
jgi:integrase